MSEHNCSAGLQTTYSNDSWEFFYDHLRMSAERQLVVRLNDEPNQALILSIEGDIWTSGSHLLVLDWNEEKQDYTDDRRIPLYLESGECAITKVFIP